MPEIRDDQNVHRHIPAVESHLTGDPPAITGANFKLHPGEDGLSVNTSAPSHIRKHKLIRNLTDVSRFAVCVALPIKKLGFQVDEDPQDGDPGHSLIKETDKAKFSSRVMRTALVDMFTLIPREEEP